MSVEAMKQALEALESWQKTCLDCGRGSEELGRATRPIAALRQAIAEAEKQEPVAFVSGLYNAPVHASDISQERVDETAKDKHEDWYGQHQWQCGYERGWEKGYEAGWDNRGEEEKNNWVGLTDEEIMEVVDQITTYRGEYMVCVGNAIEAKLKEKNT